MAQIRIPATYMRGGSSKGVFFHAGDLPDDAAERDRILRPSAARIPMAVS
jgi:2-methylaconitate cis-trans-isomerase PrpF